MINIEQLRFPSGVAAAETLRSLYAKGEEATKKAKALFVAAFTARSWLSCATTNSTGTLTSRGFRVPQDPERFKMMAIRCTNGRSVGRTA